MEDNIRPGWRTSTYTGNGGGNCVEVGDAARMILVRDTKDRTGPVLRFTPAAWRGFAKRIKRSLARGSTLAAGVNRDVSSPATRGRCRGVGAQRPHPRRGTVRPVCGECCPIVRVSGELSALNRAFVRMARPEVLPPNLIISLVKEAQLAGLISRASITADARPGADRRTKSAQITQTRIMTIPVLKKASRLY
jgi:hypothetical protein